MINQLVSIIITSYKGDAWIQEAIQSVIIQTYKNIEIIIIDDNGVDTDIQKKTEKIVSSIKDNRIKYFAHKHNYNGAVARNTGLKMCNGKYIAFLDNDDLYLPSHIETCVDILEKTGSDAVITDVVMSINNNVYDYGIVNKNTLFNDLLINKAGLYTGSNLFLKTENVRKIGGFDERFRRYQDVEFMIRYLENSKIECINEVQIVKRFNGNLNVPNGKRNLEISNLYNEKFSYLIDNLSDDNKRLFYQHINEEMFINTVYEGNKENIKSAFNKIKENGKVSRKNRIRYYIGIMGIGKLITIMVLKYKSIVKRKKYKIYTSWIKEDIVNSKKYI